MELARGLLTGLLVAAAAGVADSAQAQVEAQSRAPAGAQKRFVATAGFRVTYDNNAAGGNAALAQARRLSPEDISYQPTASVSIHQMFGRQAVFVEAAGDIERHQKNRELNGENGNVNAGVQARLGPCDAGVAGNYSKRRTATSELFSAVTKNIATQQGATAQAGCTFGAFGGSISAGHVELINSAKAGGYVDSTSQNVGFEAGYQNRRAGDLALTGQYARVRYDSPPIVAGLLTNPGFQTYSVGLMYRRMIGNRLDGEVSAAYSVVEPKGGLPTFSSWTSTANLNYRVTSRSNLALSYRRGVDPSPNALSSYNLRDSFNMSGSYSLTKRLSLQLGGSMDQSRLKGNIPILRQVREDKSKTIYGGGSLKIGRNLSVQLNAQHSERTTDLAEFNEASDHVSFALVGTF